MDQPHDIVLPLRYERASLRLAGYNFQAVARLRPGVTLPQANADVARMIDLELRKFPPPQGMSIDMMRDAKLGPNVRPLIDDLLGDIGRSLWVIMATIGMVLLIACANVANLLLVRTEGRNHELAIRASLGAGRGRIALEVLIESILLAIRRRYFCCRLCRCRAAACSETESGPIAALRHHRRRRERHCFSRWRSHCWQACLRRPACSEVHGPSSGANHAFRRPQSQRRQGSQFRPQWTDSIQVALALVLLIGSGLMIRTFQSLRDVRPGFRNPETSQTLRVSIPRTA